MIVGGQTEARAQLSSTIIDYHEPFDQGLRILNLVTKFLYSARVGDVIRSRAHGECCGGHFLVDCLLDLSVPQKRIELLHETVYRVYITSSISRARRSYSEATAL